jgi:type I restriction enzyme S subunit
MRIGIYDNLKSSGSAWLGDIPTHWGTKKLKFLATVQPSNVDKKTVEGEEPVILCNYTELMSVM